jgi:hypothetical protein
LTGNGDPMLAAIPGSPHAKAILFLKTRRCRVTILPQRNKAGTAPRLCLALRDDSGHHRRKSDA